MNNDFMPKCTVETETIKVHRFRNESGTTFYVMQHVVFVTKANGIELVIRILEADQFTIRPEFRERSSIYDYRIVAYKDNTPIYTLIYDPVHGPIRILKLIKLGNGFNNAHICLCSTKITEDKKTKTYKLVLVISDEGDLLIDTVGNNCYVKNVDNVPHYVVEKDDDNIEVYSTDGTKVL